MKKEVFRIIASVLAVTLTVSTIAACGRKKEAAGSLVASETYSEATVPTLEDDALNALVQDAVGDEKWDGDYSKLTQEQKTAVQKALAKQGYTAKVTDNGVVYYDYVPTASEEEIAAAAKKALGGKEWDGKYSSLTDDEKAAVRDELREQGYDVELGQKDFVFMGDADRKAETTKYSYDQLPTREQLAVAVAEVIGTEAYLKWDGNMLSLTEKQREEVLKLLNDYGFDLALNEQGVFYMVHNPANTVTFATAYTSTTVDGTTMAPTTISTTAPEQPTENLTGTTASKTVPAPEIERVALSTFGGSDSDLFAHVTATSDGGYVATGRFLSNDGDYAGTDSKWQRFRSSVVKYDKNGVFQWKGTVGGSSTNAYMGVLFEQSAELKDGGIVAVGVTDARSLGVVKDDASDGILVKYDKNGAQQWLKRFGGTQEDIFASVCATPDGGFVAGGRTISSDGDMQGAAPELIKAILVKFNADGEVEWVRRFNSGSNSASFVAIAVTDEGAIYGACEARVATGRNMQQDMLTYAGYGGNDVIIFKFGPDGELLTHRTLAGSGHDNVTSIAIADRGVIVGGSFTQNTHQNSVFAGTTNQGDTDAFLVRLDEYLNVEWVKTFGGLEQDTITGVTKIKGGFAAVGSSKSTNGAFSFLGSGDTDAFVLTVSENGSEIGKTALNGTKFDQAMAVAANGPRHFAVVGQTTSATNMFSGLTPAPTKDLPVSFFALYDVK
ncbi:MAG: hypothetical protein IJT44_06890 [Clostridia bacterium]|nr:hypothetical protein [Clostridia bacterium]